MKDLNEVRLIGRIVRDAEYRAFAGDSGGVCTFSLATGKQWKDAKGEQKKSTQFHYCKLFGKSADKVTAMIQKGKAIYLEGEIEYEEYTDKNGNKKHVTVIKVDPYELRFLSGGEAAAAHEGSSRRTHTEPEEGPPEPPVPSGSGSFDDDIPF